MESAFGQDSPVLDVILEEPGGFSNANTNDPDDDADDRRYRIPDEPRRHRGTEKCGIRNAESEGVDSAKGGYSWAPSSL